jgi:replication factor C large subunit
MSFVIKYRPKTLDEYVNQTKAVQQLKEYVFNFKTKYQGKALFFWGPPGVGKTALVYAFAGTYKYEVVEVNASDDRNYKTLQELFYNAAQTASLFGRGKIFVFDEVDGLSATDRGAVNTIAKIIKESKHPVILIANDPWEPKLKELRNLSILVEFKKLTITDIFTVLKRVCEKEGLKCEDKALKQLAMEAKGDLRAALNDLEALAQKGSVTLKDLEALGYREREISIFEALAYIFKAEKIGIATMAISEVDLDPDLVFLWIEENIPNEYMKPEEIYKAYEALSRADIYKARIIRRQNWSFLSYYTFMMSAGVAMAKDKKYSKFTRYQRPTFFQKLEQIKAKRELIKKISKQMEDKVKIKKSEISEFILPFLINLYKKDKNKALEYGKIFGLSKEEIDILAKS